MAEQPFFQATDAATGDRINQVAVTSLETQPWLLAFFQPQDILFAPVTSQTRNIIFFALGIGLIAAVLGIIAAVLNRKRIVIYRHEFTAPGTSSTGSQPRPPATLRRRFGRLIIGLVLTFLFAYVGGSAVDSNEELADFMTWPFFFCLLFSAYQFIAIVIIGIARVWRQIV